MAVDTYLKIDSVDGESKAKGFDKNIEVLAWSWGGSQSGTFHKGTGGAGAGKVNVNDMTITKYMDSASTVLFQSMCEGKHFKDAKIVARKAGGASPVDFLEIKLVNVMVTSVSVGGSQGDEVPHENVTLNFEKFEVKYTPQDEKGAKGGAKEMKWNMATNSAS